MPLRVLVVCLFAAFIWRGLTPMIASGQAEPSEEAVQQERAFFDFLIGDWVLEKKVTPEASWTEGDDTFTFSKVLDGAGILSKWYFNRGTPNDPNYTDGMYMSAYDEMTGTWSFYYISSHNAMYYQGRKEGDNWYFYHTFTLDGEDIVQRQSWTPVGPSKVLRTIENSRDGGETWGEAYQTTLRRKE